MTFLITAASKKSFGSCCIFTPNLRRSLSASTRSSQVTIIGNVSEIIQKSDPKESREYLDLEERYGELEKEYEEAMAIIDELEFELDDIDFLEIEIHRLREENAKLKESLEQQSSFEPPVAAFSAFSFASADADNTEDKETRDVNEIVQVEDVVHKLMGVAKKRKMMQAKLDKLRATRL